MLSAAPTQRASAAVTAATGDRLLSETALSLPQAEIKRRASAAETTVTAEISESTTERLLLKAAVAARASAAGITTIIKEETLRMKSVSLAVKFLPAEEIAPITRMVPVIAVE
ncbi:MAG TPA: hypothetical protein GXZ37_01940 [Clostridiales bacterium]|nr:hypothetical protein [Clostridiales bacterium]